MNNFRVLFYPTLSNVGFEFIKEYRTLADARLALDTILSYTLMLHETKLMPDYSNVGLIEQRVVDYKSLLEQVEVTTWISSPTGFKMIPSYTKSEWEEVDGRLYAVDSGRSGDSR